MGKRRIIGKLLRQTRFIANCNVVELTKIDTADAQLRAAVCMFFEGGHPVPVYTLANAAREIIHTIANQTGIATVAQEWAERKGMPTKDFLRPLVSTANFFKHADRDPDAKLMFDEGLSEWCSI